MIKNRYIGKFTIPRKMINDRPSMVLDIMNGMIVLKADLMPDRDCFEYLAISSKHFRGVAYGEAAPEYELKWLDVGQNSFEFREIT